MCEDLGSLLAAAIFRNLHYIDRIDQIFNKYTFLYFSF